MKRRTKYLPHQKKKQFGEEHLFTTSSSDMPTSPIASSSPGEKANCNEILAAIDNLKKDLKEDMKTKIDELKKYNDENFTSMENKITKRIETMEKKHQTEIDDLRKKYESLTLDLKSTNRRLDLGAPASSDNNMKLNNLLKLAQNMENKDRLERKLNIIIKGLNATNNLETATGVINEFLRAKFNLSNCYKSLKILGKDRYIYKITLLNTEDKKHIMTNKRRNLEGTNIYIENDLTEQQATEMRKLRNASKEHKLKGSKVKFYKNKVCINDKWMQWDEECEGLKETHAPIRNKTAFHSNAASASHHKDK